MNNQNHQPESIYDSNEYQWYILRVQSGYEKKITAVIKKHLTLSNLDHLIKDVYIPSEQVKTKKKGVEAVKDVTYFPGYILVHMLLTPDLWHAFRAIPKVSGFVTGKNNEPIPVDEKELEKINQKIKEGAKQAEIDSHFQIGQRVKIIDGPFADFNATIVFVDMERLELEVELNIFGRLTKLDKLAIDQVELIQEKESTETPKV